MMRIGSSAGKWRETTLGEIGEYFNGRGFKKSEWSDRGRMIIRIQDLTGTGDSPNYFSGPCDERQVVRDGDLLISWAATLDAFVWTGPEAVLNQHIFKVMSRVDRRFHYHLVKFVLEDIRSRAHGSGMVHVTKKEFALTRVLVPVEVDDQRAIADALEQQLTRLDAAEAVLKVAAKRLGNYRRRALRAELHANGNQPPAEWQSVRLSEVAKVQSGQTPKAVRHALTATGEIPWVQVADMNLPGNESEIRVARSWLSRRDAVALGVKVFPPGTIVFPKRGGAIATNKKRVLAVDCACDLNVMAITPSRRWARFLWLWFQQLDLRNLDNGSNVPQINHGDVAPLILSLPPLDALQGVEERLDRLLASVELLEARIAANTQMIEPLRRSLYASMFRDSSGGDVSKLTA